MGRTEITLNLSIHQWYKAIQRLTDAIRRCEKRLHQFGGGVPVDQPFGPQVAAHVRKRISETREDVERHRGLVETRRMMRQRLAVECERLGINRRSVELEALRERIRILEALDEASREPLCTIDDVVTFIETTVAGEQRVQTVQAAGGAASEEKPVHVIESRATYRRTEPPRKVGVLSLEDREMIAKELGEARRRNVTLHHEINGCHGRVLEMAVPLEMAREMDLAS